MNFVTIAPIVILFLIGLSNCKPQIYEFNGPPQYQPGGTHTIIFRPGGGGGMAMGGADNGGVVIPNQNPETTPAPPKPAPGESQCVPLNGYCNIISGLNPFAKGQCCGGLHCQIGITTDVIWPTFMCTNLAHKLGMAK